MNSASLSSELNLLIVSRSYFSPEAQTKIYYLSQNLRSVSLFHPKVSNGFPIPGEKFKFRHSSPNISVFTANTLFSDSPTFMVFNPFYLAYALLLSRAEIVLLEEDPYSFSGLITMTLVFFLRYLRPRTKLLMFSWDLLNRRPKAIISKYLKEFCIAFSRLVVDGIIAGSPNASAVATNHKKYQCPIVVLPLVGVRVEQAKPTYAVPACDLNSINIGYIGRLIPEKGVELLISVLTDLNKSMIGSCINLTIAGAGPLSVFVKSKSNEYAWIRYVGPLTHNQVKPLLKEIQLLVLPSISSESWQEQFGNILIEAMSQSIPVLGSSCGAIPHVIGNPNYIFDEGSYEDMHCMMSNIIKQKKDLHLIGHDMYLRTITLFSSHQVSWRYIQFFLCITAGANFIQRNPYDDIEILT